MVRTTSVPMTMGLVSKESKRTSKTKTAIITDKRKIKQILHNAERMGVWYDNDPSGYGRIASQDGVYRGRRFRVDYDTSRPMPDFPDDAWYDKIAFRIVMKED